MFQRGLYEDIATGIKSSKVVVACVSDEYALSTNCLLEFRFAHKMRKPIVLAVVGTGYHWESTEVTSSFLCCRINLIYISSSCFTGGNVVLGLPEGQPATRNGFR